MRLRSAGASARAASSMSCGRQRASAAITGPVHLARDVRHALGVGRRGDREAGFDDVHAQRVQGPRHLHLGRHVEREARGLFAVAQRRVEERRLAWGQ